LRWQGFLLIPQSLQIGIAFEPRDAEVEDDEAATLHLGQAGAIDEYVEEKRKRLQQELASVEFRGPARGFPFDSNRLFEAIMSAAG
jgi:hypothetical protein